MGLIQVHLSTPHSNLILEFNLQGVNVSGSNIILKFCQQCRRGNKFALGKFNNKSIFICQETNKLIPDIPEGISKKSSTPIDPYRLKPKSLFQCSCQRFDF